MIKIRIPTTQYGFLELDFEGTSEDAIAEHNRVIKMFKGGNGIEPKAFDEFLDKYLSDNTGNLETYQSMDSEQQAVIQTIKRSLKRIKARQDKQK